MSAQSRSNRECRISAWKPVWQKLGSALPKAAPCSAGPRSSAVVGGYTFLHEDLERRLARLKQTEECLLFPTGFAANMAVVSALCSSPDVTIFSDELNHASIVDGARLATRQQVLLYDGFAKRIVHKSSFRIVRCRCHGKSVWLRMLHPIGPGVVNDHLLDTNWICCRAGWKSIGTMTCGT